MASDNGGPAFPEPFLYDATLGECGKVVTSSEYGIPTGMTILDWFAGQALVSLVHRREMTDAQTYTKSDLAAEAYHYATFMLAEKRRRETTKETP